MLPRLMLAFSLLFFAPLREAWAGGNAGQAAIAGGTTLGLELGGTLVGGAAGFGIAVAVCDPDDTREGGRTDRQQGRRGFCRWQLRCLRRKWWRWR